MLRKHFYYIILYIEMILFDDILKGSDNKFSLKNVHALLSFVSGIIICFVIVVCKFYGKDISLEIPTLLFTTSLGLNGISGWQNLAHYKINNAVAEASAANATSDKTS